MFITMEWLEEQHACSEKREVFAKTWPDGAEITEANLIQAVEVGLSITWLAVRILSSPQWFKYGKMYYEQYQGKFGKELDLLCAKLFWDIYCGR